MTPSQLIEKHLAEGLTAQEAADFTTQLIEDPEIARQMAEAARLEARLQASLGPQAASVSWPDGLMGHRPERRWRPQWSAPLARIAAVLALVGAGFAALAWIRSASTSRSAPIATGTHSRTRPFVPPPVPVVRSSEPREVKPETESPSMAALRRLLASYYLTELNMQTARPLEQAVQGLLNRARAVNRLNNPQIAQLSFEANDEELKRDRSVSLPTDHLSLLNALQWIAALNRSDLFLKEPGVITFRPWEMAHADSFATEEMSMPPHLLVPKERPDAIGLPATGSAVEPAPPLEKKLLTPKELFLTWGVAFWGAATAAYDEPSGTVRIHHTESSLRMIREIVDLIRLESTDAIKVTAEILEFSEGNGPPQEMVRFEKFRDWLKTTNPKPGINLISELVTEVTARSGQQAKIEAGESGGGWRFSVQPMLEGETITLKGTAELWFPKTRPPGQDSLFAPGNASVGELEVIETDVDGWVPAGQTAVFALDETTDRPRIVMTVTVNRVPAP